MKIHVLTAALAVSLPLATAYVGEMTFYAVGMGSCGVTSVDTDDVVALSIHMMGNGGNANANPKCHAQISIYNPDTKTEHNATVVDTCQACSMYDIDVSPSLFKKIAPAGDGRVKGVDWGGRAVGG